MKENRLFQIKYGIVLSVLLMVMLFLGCEDALLDQKPRGELTLANFFQTEQHAIEATNTTYERLRDFNVHSFPWLGVTDIASDDANKGSTPADATFLTEISDFTFDPTNGAFLNTWRGYYQGIFRANLAIVNIPDIEMDEFLKQRLIAENKFLRAYYYFYLVRAFGGVPLSTAPLRPSEFEQERATAEEVFTQIKADLFDAIEVLPEKSEYDSSDLGRATKGAARALVAQVLLFQSDFTGAEQFAREVINSGEYSLYPDYEKIFQPEGENSSESVFEIQAIALETGLGGTQFSQVQGVRGTPNLGWGFNNPSDDLLNAYEPGDPRLNATVLFVHETLPFGPPAIVRLNASMPENQRYNQKAFVPLDTPGGTGNAGTNIRRIRYADVLLIAAEAAFQNGNTSDALTFVNMVRERARDGRTATIGIEVEALDEFIANLVGDSDLEGRPFVRFVGANGPADNAEILEIEWVTQGRFLLFTNIDIIQSIDGVQVSTPDEFKNEMSTKNPNQTIEIEVLRITESINDAETLFLTLTTQELLPDISATGQQLIEAIWHERRTELAMEQHRFFDLRRTGRAGDVLRALGANFEDNKHDLFPIPRDELDVNPALTQNPGY